MLLFYTLLVFPKERLSKKTKYAFQEMDRVIENLHPCCNSTYNCDKPSIKYMRHIRNAIAHGRIKVDKNSGAIFQDESKAGESFSVSFTLDQLSNLATNMQTSVVEGLYNKAKV